MHTAAVKCFFFFWHDFFFSPLLNAPQYQHLSMHTDIYRCLEAGAKIQTHQNHVQERSVWAEKTQTHPTIGAFIKFKLPEKIIIPVDETNKTPKA